MALPIPAPASAETATAYRKNRRRESLKNTSRNSVTIIPFSKKTARAVRTSTMRGRRPAPASVVRTSEQMANADLHAVDGAACGGYVFCDRTCSAERERCTILVAQMRVGAIQHGALG